jgi:hypothetical protein
MRNAAALADKKERSAGLEAQLRAKQSTLPGNRHRAIYAGALCQKLFFPRIRAATAVPCRSQCRAADRGRRKRRRDER